MVYVVVAYDSSDQSMKVKVSHHLQQNPPTLPGGNRQDRAIGVHSHQRLFDTGEKPGGIGAYLVEDFAVNIDGLVENVSLGDKGSFCKNRTQGKPDA